MTQKRETEKHHLPRSIATIHIYCHHIYDASISILVY